LKLKRILFVFITVVIANISAKAQITVNGNFGVALPMGSFSDVTSVGMGFNVGGQYQINKEMRAGASFGYFGFFGSNITILNKTTKAPGWSIIPITGTYSYSFYTYNEFTFLGGADLSLYLCRIRVVGSTFEPHFGLAPYVGTIYNLNDWVKLTGTIKYNAVFSGSALMYLSLNVGAEMPIEKIIGLFKH
jgi:hypothetical protein